MISAVQQLEPASPHAELISAISDVRMLPELQHDGWLHAIEQLELQRLKNDRRREAWLCGRWVAKQLVRQVSAPQSCDLASIAISSRNDQGESVRPTVSIHGETQDWSLSISHGERLVAGCLETHSTVSIGIDVMTRQTLTPGFLSTWFTPREQAWAGEAGADAACFIWAAKEAVYKAINDGEKFAPRKIEILLDENDGYHVCYGGRDLSCDISSTTIDDDLVVVAKHARNIR